MPLSNEETLDLISKIKLENDQEMKNILIERLFDDNVGLIKDVALSLKRDNIELDDLIQEGYLAFIKAIDNFDSTKKVKFQTFAYKVMQSKLTRYINEYEKTISVPEYISTTLNKIMDVEEELENTLKRKPTSEEVASKMNMDLDEYNKLKHYAIHVFNLEHDHEDEDKPLRDYVISYENNPEEEMISQEEIELLEFSMQDSLKDYEKDIIEKYFGLNNKEKKTTVELSKEYNLSSEKIRQIVKHSINKLRNALEDEDEN